MEGKILIFNRWDLSEVKVEDPGLVNYINLEPVIVPRSGGKHATTAFHKNKMNIVERFMNKLMVPGHRGRKHKRTSGRCVGHTVGLYNDMKEALAIIEKRTGKNPVQVLVGAIENGALMEEVAAYRMGGIIARQAVVVAPQRRLDMSLRHLTQGIYKSKFKSKIPLPEVIANELMAAYSADPKSFAIQERNRIEKEAEGAR
jgi:small subunit ribosomal protein S7